MKLPAAEARLARPAQAGDARSLLPDGLAATRALVSPDGNELAWSSWENAAAAMAERRALRASIEAGDEPDPCTRSVLFARAARRGI